MDATSEHKDSAPLLSCTQHPGARRKTSVKHKASESRIETQRGLGNGVGRRAATQEQNSLPVENNSLNLQPETELGSPSSYIMAKVLSPVARNQIWYLTTNHKSN